MEIITLSGLRRFHANLLNFLLGKQDKLVSGENIATINNISLLNGGNITISAAEGTLMYDETPTPNSTNLVNSGSVYSFVKNVDDRISQLHTETVLFESTSASYSDITLNDSVSNYKYIEVFGETSDGYVLSTKLYNCNGKKFILSVQPISSYSSSSTFEFHFKEYSINNNTFVVNSDNCGIISVTSNGKHNKTNDANSVGITLVIGYK